MFTHINQGSGPEGFSGYGSLLALLGNQTPTVPQQAAWGPQQCHAPTVGGLYKTFPLFNKAESSSEPSLPRVGWAGIHRALSSSRAVRRGLHLEKKKKKKKKNLGPDHHLPVVPRGQCQAGLMAKSGRKVHAGFVAQPPPPFVGSAGSSLPSHPFGQ